MNALTPRLPGCKSLIVTMTEHVSRHTNMIEEEHCLEQRLQQKFLETTYQAPLTTLKQGAEVVIPPTSTPSEKDLDEER